MIDESYQTKRDVVESEFETFDGVRLFYRFWPALRDQARGAIIMFHRGHEHGGRMAHLVDELDMPDYTFFAWDARGLGLSPGIRGAAPSFAALVRDTDMFVRHISEEHGIAISDMALIGQSVGAVIASCWAHDYAPGIRAMVLASPAFSIKLYVPFAMPALRLLQKIRGNFFVHSYVKARFLTHDPERIRSFENDPLIARPIAVNLLLELAEASQRIVTDARAINVPVLLLISGADRVVRHEPQHRFFVNLGSRKKKREVLSGFYHDTLGELRREKVMREIRRFLGECFDQEPDPPSLLDAHLSGYTRDEAERLASPLPPASVAGMYWAGYRAAMKLGGRLSRGIALGHETGFDSGSTLDYVYRNKAQGLGPIGRAIDRNYLDAIGWRGIRQRKKHLEELIRLVLARLENQGQPLHIVDIAAGHGRYVLEAIQQSETVPDSILLRDYSDINVSHGRSLIRTMGLDKVARFEKGNAFDGDDLAAITPAPTLGIVSGLYELFTDNDQVSGSLGGLARAIRPGGYLLYTNQPYHPQLEMIARALTSHRQGLAWVMRRRTQAEMDQLVVAAGFEKIEQRIDKWGIFSVSMARRLDRE